MKLKNLIITVLFITMIIFLGSIHKVIHDNDDKDNLNDKYPLKRKNALTEEEIEKILKEINGKNKNLK